MRIAAALVLALLGAAAAAAAAADAPLPAGEVLMRVRTEVAQLLGKKPADVGVAKPLAAQGADELDIVEIVMALEEEFGISIPDDAIESDGMGWNVLTVQRLAQIVQNLKRGAPPQP